MLMMLSQDTRLRLASLALRLTKRVTPHNTWSAFSACARELLFYKKHLAGVRRSQVLVSNGNPLRLELGGGPNSTKPGWINVDLAAQDGLTLDLRRPLPFPDESVESIYSEHVLEHLVYPDDLSRLLAECYRVLEVGGTFTVGVPDAGRAFRAYSAGVGEFYFNKYWPSVQPRFADSSMDELNWLIYMGGVHHYMFDRQNLMLRLEETGFVDIEEREFDPAIDRPDRQHQTMYVHAKKAAAVPPEVNDIRKRHVRKVIDEFASYEKVVPMVNNLNSVDHYAVLRLAMLVSGRHGDTLVVGHRAGTILSILELLKPSTNVQTFAIMSGRSEQFELGSKINERIQHCHYPPISFPDDRFKQVMTIMTKDDLSSANSILKDIGRVLTSDPNAWAYVIFPGDFNLEIPNLFICIHKESLPADAGTLVILKHVAVK